MTDKALERARSLHQIIINTPQIIERRPPAIPFLQVWGQGRHGLAVGKVIIQNGNN